MNRFLQEKPLEKFFLLGLSTFALATAVQIGCSNQQYDAGLGEDGVSSNGYDTSGSSSSGSTTGSSGSSGTHNPPVITDAGAASSTTSDAGDAGDAGKKGSGTGTGSGTGSPGTNTGNNGGYDDGRGYPSSSSGEAQQPVTTATPRKSTSSGCSTAPNSTGSFGFAAMLGLSVLLAGRKKRK